MTQRTIPEIDREINALRRTVPQLADRMAFESALFRERGFAQLEHDEKAARLAMLAPWPKAPPRNKCPACRGTGYQARP